MTRKTLHFISLMLGIILVLASVAIAQRAQKKDRSLVTIEQNIILAESANLDQCRNGTEATPLGCATVNEWVNGNANHENAHWSETEFIVYRMRFEGLSLVSHTVTIGYDILKSGKHAIDYLGTYNSTETTANPCAGVAGCTGTPDQFDIPPDTATVTNQTNPDTGLPLTQKAGKFSMWGGDITDVQYLAYAGGEERQIIVTFTPTVSNPVLAWGGHIAWMGDWGTGNSATAVSGSPYHMRLIEFGVTGGPQGGGNQDRALDNTAVVPSGVVNIFKEVFTAPPNVSNAATTMFNFTASSNFGATTFGLIDDNAGPGVDVKQSGPITSFGTPNTITVTESSTLGWTLLNVNCVENVTQDSTKNSASPTATIVVQAGETVTCTFQNSQLVPTAAPATISGRIMTSGDRPVYNAIIGVTNMTTGQVSYARSNAFGYYQASNLPTGALYVVCVTAKGYTFSPDSIVVSLTNDFTKANFTAAK